MTNRVHDGAVDATESTYSADSTPQTKLTFTRTPTANSTAIIFASCLLSGSSTSLNSYATLYNSTSMTTLCESVHQAKDTTDYVRCTMMAIQAFGASPASTTWQLNYATESSSNTVGIKSATLNYIELTAAEFYVVSDGPHTVTDTNYVTCGTLTETFESGVDYYVVAYADQYTTSTSAINTCEAFYDSATVYGQSIRDMNDADERIPWFTVFKITGDGTSKTTIVRSKSSSTIDVVVRNVRIAAFKASEFPITPLYDESRSRVTTSSTTYQTANTSTHTLSAVPHLVLSAAVLDCGSTTQSALYQLTEDTVSQGEHIHEPNTSGETGGARCVGQTYRKTFSAASHTLLQQYKAETSATMGLKESAVLLLPLEAAAGGGAVAPTSTLSGPLGGPLVGIF